jgi:hypothetical protein
MVQYCTNDLKNIKLLISQLSDNEYSSSINCLSGSSIGQHIRHILEFYICLLDGIPIGIINYDNRKRDINLETDTLYSAKIVDSICVKLALFDQEIKDIFLQANFDIDKSVNKILETSVSREMSYCLEHSIHHQALIKIGLSELNPHLSIDKNFGIAPSTIRNITLNTIQQ